MEGHSSIFKRSIEHVDGNWPSFIRIPVGPKRLVKIAKLCCQHFVLNEGSGLAPFVVESNPHISLSKLLVLRYHQIESFVNALALAVLSVPRFWVQVRSEYSVFTNEDKSRSFVSIILRDYGSDLNRLTESINNVLQRFSLPTYYNPPQFHVSVLSFVPPAGYVWQKEDVPLKGSDGHSVKLDEFGASRPMRQIVPISCALSKLVRRAITKEESSIQSLFHEWSGDNNSGGSDVSSDSSSSDESEISSSASDNEGRVWNAESGICSPDAVDNAVLIGGDCIGSTTETEAAIEKGEQREVSFGDSTAYTIVMPVNFVECVIGNKLYRIHLQDAHSIGLKSLQPNFELVREGTKRIKRS